MAPATASACKSKTRVADATSGKVGPALDVELDDDDKLLELDELELDELELDELDASVRMRSA